jgi:hypothetical protein
MVVRLCREFMRATQEVSMRCILYEAFHIGIEHLGDGGMELKTFCVRQVCFLPPLALLALLGLASKPWFKL